MQKFKYILKKIDEENKVFFISLNRVKKLNAINHEMLEELTKILKIISTCNDVKAVVIESNHESVFSAGLDIEYVSRLTNCEAASFLYKISETLNQIQSIQVPTISLVDGYAIGAGADIALACDIRIATKQTQFRFPGPQFGVILGTHRLVNEVGTSIARKILYLNECIGANKSKQYGIVHKICEYSNSKTSLKETLKLIDNIPIQTLLDIRNIGNNYSGNRYKLKSPSEYTRDSVKRGDFKKRLNNYLIRIADE